jgi:hypothetical protein
MTLIELIFAMVIVAVVFMVIPRILFVANKSHQLGMKEDGLFDAVSLTGQIVRLPWDENTLETEGKILQTGTNDCNTSTGYRIGGFVGSRNCIGGTLDADDQANGDCDDIDDFNDAACYEGNDTAHGKDYTLSVQVDVDGGNPNLKTVQVTVASDSGRLGGGTFSSQIAFRSYNLGWIQINRRPWR